MAFSLAVGLVTKLLGDLKHTALVSAPSYARRLGTLIVPIACLLSPIPTASDQKL